jgi:hypothetical protein
MKHLFVSLEIALALKEKGFDEPCLACYTYYSEEHHFELLTDYFNISSELRGKLFINNSLFLWLKEHEIGGKCYVLQNAVAAPTGEQVVEWFRDKHSIYIAVLPFREKAVMFLTKMVELCWYYSIVQDDEDLPDILCNEDDLGAHGDNYATPKIAWEEAFLEALKLI